MTKWLIVFISAANILTISDASFAKSKGNPQNHTLHWEDASYTAFTENEYPQMTETTGTVNTRKPSTAEYDFLVNRTLATKNASEFQALIDTVKKEKATYRDASTLFLAEHLLFAETMRGSLWKLRPLMEKKHKKNHILQSAVVSFIKQSVAANNIFNSQDDSAAYLDYVAAPYTTNNELASTIQTEDELQQWLHSTVRPKTMALIQSLNTLSKEPTVRWDRRITFGADSFQDGLGKDIVMGPEELQSLIASYELGLVNIDAFCAYRQNQVFDISRAVGRVSGFDGLLFSGVDGVTGIEIAEIISKSDYKDLWTLKTEGNFGTQSMREAGFLLKSAVNRTSTVWNHLKKRQDRSDVDAYSLPFSVVHLNVSTADTYISNMIKILNGQPIVSMQKGEVARVNLSNFFQNPPEDLKKFYPTKFDQTLIKKATLTVNGKSVSMPYRNYGHGTAIGWDLPTYQRFFDVKNDQDIKRTLRVLNQTTSGFAAK